MEKNVHLTFLSSRSYNTYQSSNMWSGRYVPHRDTSGRQEEVYFHYKGIKLIAKSNSSNIFHSIRGNASKNAMVKFSDRWAL